MSYRILSLNGGGAWALIQVKVLMDLYGPTTCGRQVLADFDIVAANSGSRVSGGREDRRSHERGDVRLHAKARR